MPAQDDSPQLGKATSVLALTTLLSLALACGGGGGGGGGNDSAAPPRPTQVPLPVDPPAPSDPSTARIAVRNGDRASDGFVVGNIEDAALASDGSVALIASGVSGDLNAVLRQEADGSLETIFDESNAPANVDLENLSRLRMAPTGELAFRSGSGLDADQLHLALANEVQTIAGTAGAIPPDFRTLGNFRVVTGGLVAFVGGGGECETETSGDSVRNLCTLSLYLANGSEVIRIDHPDFQLDRRQANDAQIAMNEEGELFFSVPGRRESPVVVRFDGQGAESILRNNGELPEWGEVSRVDIVDLDSEGRLLVELGLPPLNPEDPVLDHVGLLDGNQFTEFAVEGAVEGDRSVFSLRGIGLGGGRALFEATLLDASTGEQSSCLRLGDATSTIELVCEGDPFPGLDLEVFSIAGARINAGGDVLFVTSLGNRSDDTTRVEERRATVRRADGQLVTIVTSADADRLGTITELTTVGFNDAGQALLIAERSRSSDRVLFLGDSRE